MLHLIAEDHCRAYMFWKELGVRGATCVHVDAHLDVGDSGLTPARLAGLARARSEQEIEAFLGSTYVPGKGLNCGNYLTPALLEGIVEHLVCVLPPWIELSLEGARRELQLWVDLTLAEYRSLKWAEGRVEGVLRGRRLTLCRATALPPCSHPLLLDIDLDYLIDEQREIWQQPEELLRELGELQPDVLTVACSVHGGYTPQEACWMGPALLRGFGIEHPRLDVPESPLDRGSALFRLGWADQALRALELEDSSESRYLQGMICYREGNYARALELLEQPFMRGAALYRAGRFAEAVQELHQAVKREPTPDALHLLGLAWAGAGRPEMAAQWFQTALRQAPDRLSTQVLRHDLGLETEVEVEGLRRRVPP
ncbi:hypothetical protein DYH09_32760 [bacterium CPR1]|nr:hypothetical protein [bacterium CPR1]